MTTLEEFLLSLSDAIKVKTGNVFYDETYPVLVEAGKNLSNAVHENKDFQQYSKLLAMGLCGWNTGPARYKAANKLLGKKPEEWKEFLDLILDQNDSPKLCFIETKKFLNVGNHSKALPSKLLHWLSPESFPILDSIVEHRLKKNVGDVILNGSTPASIFDEYTKNLRVIENSGNFDFYKSSDVSFMRCVDCTIFQSN